MIFHESENVELKEIYIEDIKKEIIAFANSNGGKLYIGVNDDGIITGLSDPDDVILKISNSCRDSVKPDITMFLSYRTISEEGKSIVEVTVQRGTARPYYIANKGLRSSGVYVRQGTSSAPASDTAIRQMIKESDGDSFECIRSLNQELTFVEASRTFNSCGVEFHEPQMRTLGMVNDDGIFTNLALLLSDQCPHIIKAATFSGTDKDEFQDRKEFTGSLLKQLNDAYAYMDMRNRTKATFEGLYRIDTRDYPEQALREALLNAIVHRDYSLSASTLISIYDNRMEVVSYGGLTGDVTMEDVMNGLSVCRNEKLANVFYRLKLIEAYGTGLKKIRKSYDDIAPEINAGPHSFKVVLPNINTL